MTKTTNTTYLMAPNTIYLYDYITGECCGPATDEQITASEATDTGAILIDTRTGEVLTAGHGKPLTPPTQALPASCSPSNDTKGTNNDHHR
jgi:hypothetical protein